MDTLAFSAFLVGLLGGIHCAAMCDGIVAALNLPVTGGPVRDGARRSLWAYCSPPGLRSSVSTGGSHTRA